MQFTGHPLLVHQFVTVPWDFNPVPYCQPSSPTPTEYALPPSLEWHVWPGRRSIYNNPRSNDNVSVLELQGEESGVNSSWGQYIYIYIYLPTPPLEQVYFYPEFNRYEINFPSPRPVAIPSQIIPVCRTILALDGGRKSIRAEENSNSLAHDLNPGHRVNFPWRYPLHHAHHFSLSLSGCVCVYIYMYGGRMGSAIK